MTPDARGALPDCSRALVIAAHPDDVESWCAGTLALLIARETGEPAGLEFAEAFRVVRLE